MRAFLTIVYPLAFLFAPHPSPRARLRARLQVEKDVGRAQRWLRQASKLHHPDAMYQLGASMIASKVKVHRALEAAEVAPSKKLRG